MDKLEDVVIQALEAVAQYNTQKKSKRNAWIAGLAAGVLTLVALVVLFWKLSQNHRKHARIAHERDMLLEQQTQAKVDAQIATNVQAMDELLGRADGLQASILELEEKLTQVRADSQRRDEVILALKTWEQVDRFLEARLP